MTLGQAVQTPTLVGLAALDPLAPGGGHLPLPGNASTVAFVPGPITIHAGQKTGQFTITTQTVPPGATRKATIMAGGVDKIGYADGYTMRPSRFGPGNRNVIRVKSERIFCKIDKIWLFIDFSGAARRGLYWGKGQPERKGFVQNGIEDVVGCGGNRVELFGVDEGIEKVWFIPVKVERQRVVRQFRGWVGIRLRLGDVGRDGLGFPGGIGIARIFICGLVLLLAEPLRRVDLRLDGWGRGLRPGQGEAAVRDQAFDSYDHRKSLDLAGDGTPVTSGLRAASSQSRFRIWSRPKFSLRSPSASCPPAFP